MTRSSKTFVVSVATLIAALVLSTTAVAALGTATSGGGWTITLGTAPSTLTPGASEQIPFTITNAGHDTTALSGVTVTIVTEPDGDAETVAGTEIPGCLAGWFTASVDAGDRALPPQMTTGASYAGGVDLAMRDSGTDQDACRDAAPAVSVTAR